MSPTPTVTPTRDIDANPDQYTHGYSYPNEQPHADTDADPNEHTHPNADADPNDYAHADTNTYRRGVDPRHPGRCTSGDAVRNVGLE